MLPTHISAAPISQNRQQMQYVLSTPDQQTALGPAHLEVQSFEINSPEDLAAAKLAISFSLKNTKRFSEFFVYEASVQNYRINSLEVNFQSTVNEIKNEVSADHISVHSPVVVSSPKTKKFNWTYNHTLAIVRAVANGGTVMAGLVIGKGVPVEHSALIGVLVGGLAFGMQIHNDWFTKILTNSVKLVDKAKQLKLLPESSSSGVSRREKLLKESSFYTKWAITEAAFLLICNTAMSMLHIPLEGNFLMTVVKSTASQGLYDNGVIKTSEVIEKINPNWTGKTNMVRHVAVFGGSAISVLSAIGTMVEMPFSYVGFIVLASSGVVLTLAPKIILLKPVQQILQKIADRQSTAQISGGRMQCHRMLLGI